MGRIPDPIAYLRTSWSTDPFALCSYSYLAPHPWGGSARAHLGEPVGRLHFAGEATAVAEPACTRGAVHSGRRVAQEIISTGAGGTSVIIVGAGFAGVSCAHDLAAQGYRVQIVEARDRIGGRIWTEQLGGITAELGASWIHGVEGNPITELLHATGGRRYDFNYDNVSGRDEDAYAELERCQSKLTDLEQPDTTPIAAVFPTPLPAALAYACNAYYAQEYGADIDELAVSAMDEYPLMRGGDVLLPDGYDKLVQYLLGDLPVQLNSVVDVVRHDNTSAAVVLTDGTTITADHVVVTVPIGVLKACSIIFEPALPSAKQHAIAALGAGLLDKLWLEFPEVFWDSEADVLEWFDPDNPGRWSWWVNGYRVFGKPILLGFNGSHRARELAHATDEQVIASAMDALRRMHTGLARSSV